MERFRRSGQTVVRFCAEERVSGPTFYQWKKRLGQRTGLAASGVACGKAHGPAPAFQPIEIIPVQDETHPTTVQLPHGIAIEFGSDLRVVESVVKVLLADVTSKDGTTSC